MELAIARRACLSVPGASEKMLAKARELVIDEVVLDLEDAVRPEDKVTARARVLEALTGDGWTANVAVRVNAPRSPWCHEDLAALAAAGPALTSVVVPKVESPGDLAFVERLLDGAEAAHGRAVPLRVQALLETARGVAGAQHIAAASPRLDALILGYADLAASLGRSKGAATEPARWLAAQDAILFAARAHGLQAIDGPWLGTAVDEPFLAAVRHAAGLGFDGKWAIHPAQVEPLHEAFAPTDAEVARARAVLEALDAAEGGAVALDGEMLDEAVAVAARRVLARAATVTA